jgi:hypothetical protein
LSLAAGGTLTWNTFLGSGALNEDYSTAIAADASGNSFEVGQSHATWGSPVRVYTAGADAFVSKLDSAGNLLRDTFFRAVPNGSSLGDIGRGIAVNASGTSYVTGDSSHDWGTPIRSYTGGSDGFVASLNPADDVQCS